MTNAALQTTDRQEPPKPRLYLIKSQGVSTSKDSPSNLHIPILALVLVSLQVLDGILTYTGMHAFGLAAEGNPLLRELMHTVGVIPALTITKLGCIAIVLALCSQARHIFWLPTALTCVAGIYAFAAILPWSWILASRYLI